MNLGECGLIEVHRMVVERLRLVASDEDDGVHLETELNELRKSAGGIALIAVGATVKSSDDDVD